MRSQPRWLRGKAESCRTSAIGNELGDRRTELIVVLGIDEDAAFSVDDLILYAASSTAGHGLLLPHRLRDGAQFRVRRNNAACRRILVYSRSIADR